MKTIKKKVFMSISPSNINIFNKINNILPSERQVLRQGALGALGATFLNTAGANLDITQIFIASMLTTGCTPFLKMTRTSCIKQCIQPMHLKNKEIKRGVVIGILINQLMANVLLTTAICKGLNYEMTLAQAGMGLLLPYATFIFNEAGKVVINELITRLDAGVNALVDAYTLNPETIDLSKKAEKTVGQKIAQANVRQEAAQANLVQKLENVSNHPSEVGVIPSRITTNLSQVTKIEPVPASVMTLAQAGLGRLLPNATFIFNKAGQVVTNELIPRLEAGVNALVDAYTLNPETIDLSKKVEKTVGQEIAQAHLIQNLENVSNHPSEVDVIASRIKTNSCQVIKMEPVRANIASKTLAEKI